MIFFFMRLPRLKLEVDKRTERGALDEHDVDREQRQDRASLQYAKQQRVPDGLYAGAEEAPYRHGEQYARCENADGKGTDEQIKRVCAGRRRAKAKHRAEVFERKPHARRAEDPRAL